MNKKHKRILSLLLCIAMLFTILPTTAIAADATETVGVSTKEALSAALGTGGSGNVVLESDILDITNQLTVGRNVTLDLNGHHMKIFITAGKENGIKIAKNVILTIMDSSNPSTGKLEIGTDIKGGYNGYGAGINTTDGTLIIESGTVISNGEVSATGIGGGTGAEGTAGNIIINGGTVIANYIGDSMFLHHNTVTINGGTVKSLFISTPVNSAGEALSR